MGIEKIKVAVVDDHQLLRTAFTTIINGFEDCIVTNQAANGKDLIEQLLCGPLPDLVLLDFNMPIMNGLDTALWLQKHQPQIPVLMLTMYGSEIMTIKLLQAGIKGMLQKNIGVKELHGAIRSVAQPEQYYSFSISSQLAKLFIVHGEKLHVVEKALLNDQEIDLLRFSATELTYKTIASKMGISVRKIDTMRDRLFLKLSVSNRVGLALFAIRSGLVSIEEPPSAWR